MACVNLNARLHHVIKLLCPYVILLPGSAMDVSLIHNVLNLPTRKHAKYNLGPVYNALAIPIVNLYLQVDVSTMFALPVPLMLIAINLEQNINAEVVLVKMLLLQL